MNDRKVQILHIVLFALKKVYELWFKRFTNGNENLEDQEGRGRKSSDINDSSDHFLLSREMAILSHIRDLGKTLKLRESNRLPRFTVASSLPSLNQ